MNELETLRSKRERNGRITPSYDGWSVANVPDTVAQLLDIPADRPLSNQVVSTLMEDEDPINHVVLVVIDGFGWNQLDSCKAYLPRLGQLVEDTTVSPLTSTYPSETAAAMTTLYTGLQPVEHGLIGWYTRFDDPPMIGHSLPFLSLDGQPLDEKYGVDPTHLFDTSHREPITERLVAAAVDVGYLNPAHIVGSTTSELTAGSATLLGYDELSEAFTTVTDRIEGAANQTYHLVYWGETDTQGHHHGTESREYRQEVHNAIEPLYTEFVPSLPTDVAKETAILIVADHGQVNTDPSINTDITSLEAAGAVHVSDHLEQRSEGEPLYLAGGPRNVQFHLKPGCTQLLRSALEAAVPVTTYEEAEYREASLFGDRLPSEYFDRRAPELLAVPHEGSLWFDDGELDHVGMHGGMHPDEMLVPLFGARASRLQ